MNHINAIRAQDLEEAIIGLKRYVQDDSINPLLSALDALKEDPGNESLLASVSETFSALGFAQGAVLTYAPYLSVILSNNLFEDD